MSVNIKRLNYLKKVLAVQEVYKEHKKEGITNKYVWRHHIHEQYYISLCTMYVYLGINAKREIRDIETQLSEAENIA